MAPSAIDGHTNGHANGSLNAKATSFTPAVDSKYHASSSQEAMTVEAEYAAHNYHPLPIVFAKAQGTSVWDPEGKHYLDFLSAYSAVNQGHCHPKLIQALTEQASRLTLSSRAFYNDVFPKFAEKVTSMMGFEMVLPMNTGAEAVETVVKIARKWGYKVKGIPQDKALVLSVKENFHGRTFSAITMSTDPESKENYGPYLPGLGSVCPATGKPLPFNDADALEEALEHHGKEVAAFLVEPIQGEAGIVVPDESYLKKVRELCTKHNVLLICDEIQTGIARTGRLLCHEWSGIKPDLVLLGKAISGGMYPVSCVLGSKEVMLTVEPGTHGSTYGGNPLGSAVAIKALEIIEEEQLTERAERLGEIFRQGLRDIQKRDPMISLIRGKGLLNAIVIDESKTNGHSAWDLCMLMKEKGLLAKPTHQNIIRLAPPLVISDAEIQDALRIIEEAVTELPMPQSEKKAQATTTAPLPTHEAVTQKKAQVTTAAPVPDHSDAIHIKNLQLPFGILAPDVWGQVKQQPALLTIHLPLLRGFHSASDADRLDSSTIHYGTLAKEIRASSRADQTLAEVSQNVGAVIAKLAASGALARSRVLIALPKASMAGESVEITQVTEFGDKGDRIGVETEFAVQDVKVMTLVGVNGYEREAKQPLVVSVRLSTREEHWAPMFQLEQTLVQIIQDTTFETLEKLVEFTYQQLRTKVLDATFPGARVQLRIEKPRAIAFADAPAVEISRTVPSA